MSVLISDVISAFSSIVTAAKTDSSCRMAIWSSGDIGLLSEPRSLGASPLETSLFTCSWVLACTDVALKLKRFHARRQTLRSSKRLLSVSTRTHSEIVYFQRIRCKLIHPSFS